METLECIRSRRSIRKFKADEIDDETLLSLLESAIQAPSAGNTQEWHFFIIREQASKQKLAEAAMGQGFLVEAPVVIVVAADLEEIGRAYGERGRTLYAIQDTAAAIQNLLLAAWDRGLGACWVGAFSEKAVSDLLALPSHLRPVALIPLGRPAEMPRKPERKGLEGRVHWEHW